MERSGKKSGISPYRQVGAENLKDLYNSGNFQKGDGFGAAALFAPWHKTSPRGGIIALSLVMEMVGVLVFTFFLNLAKYASTTGTDVLLDGAVVGFIGGGTYYMITQWRSHYDQLELQHHYSTSISFAYLLCMKIGLVVFLGYLAMQILGAAVSGAILMGFGAGTLPTPANPNIGITWGTEILGSGVIIFTLLYCHLVGDVEKEEESDKFREAQKMAAWARGLITIVLFKFQGYSFDFVVYFAGLIASCDAGNGCPNALPFNNAPVFYGFLPWLGAIGAVLLLAIFLWFYGIRKGVVCELKEKVGTKINAVQNRHTGLRNVATSSAGDEEWLDEKGRQ